jgi:hypothetical protein
MARPLIEMVEMTRPLFETARPPTARPGRRGRAP